MTPVSQISTPTIPTVTLQIMDEPINMKNAQTEWLMTESTDSNCIEDETDEEEDHPDILKMMESKKNVNKQ